MNGEINYPDNQDISDFYNLISQISNLKKLSLPVFLSDRIGRKFIHDKISKLKKLSKLTLESYYLEENDIDKLANEEFRRLNMILFN